MAIDRQADIALLRVAIRSLAETWIATVTQQLGKHFPGLALTKIAETLRTAERQEEAYRDGSSRFQDGFHCYGMAWDFACFDDRGIYIKTGEHPYYTKCGLIAESLGLTWGGSWIRKDYDHVQVAGFTLQQLKNGEKTGAVVA